MNIFWIYTFEWNHWIMKYIQYILVCAQSLSRVQLFVTPWAVAHQAPLSMDFYRQEYWSGYPFPSPGDLPNPGIEPRSPALLVDFLLSDPTGKPVCLSVFSFHSSRTNNPWKLNQLKFLGDLLRHLNGEGASQIHLTKVRYKHKRVFVSFFCCYYWCYFVRFDLVSRKINRVRKREPPDSNSNDPKSGQGPIFRIECE